MGKGFCSSARKGNASGRRLTGGAGLHTKPTTDEVLVMDTLFIRLLAQKGDWGL